MLSLHLVYASFPVVPIGLGFYLLLCLMLRSTSCFCFPYNMITVVDYICAWFMVFLFLRTIKTASETAAKIPLIILLLPLVIMAQLCSDNELQYILGLIAY